MKNLLFVVSLLLSQVAQAQIELYPMPYGQSPSDIYDVTIIDGGRELRSNVYTDVAEWKTNRCETTSFSSFAASGEVKVRVKTHAQKIDFCQILPRRHEVECRIIDDSTVEFTLPGVGQYSVEFEQGIEITHPLLLFVDDFPVKRPAADMPDLIVFEEGIHEIGDSFELKSNQTVYLAPGAYVKGQFIARNQRNITITGQGIMSGEEYPARSHNHMIAFIGCDNVLVEGITIINAPRYCVSLGGGMNHICRNLKMMGWWFSTDGIGLGSNGLIENCFFKVNDDSIKLYRSNTVARNCVIWQMENGAPFQIGWNMPGYNSNFHVHDIDIIRVEHPWDNPNEAVFDAIHGSEGIMAHYLYEDIRIDNCDNRLFHLMTRPNRFGSWNPERGEIRDVTFRNIECYTQPQRRDIVMGHDERHQVSNVIFENITVDGKRWRSIDDTNFITDPRTTKNLIVR